ncbi:MAG: histidine kinase N-terminal domain-containing protein, partial [Sebaldella sp.]|nr:histidine kinase N-terminal domain-containing protein [Sebaldella sp.]
KNEPAVLRTLETGLPSRDYKALTQENTLVRQNVVPIKNEKEEVIGVLIVEEGSNDTGLNKELNFLHDATNELLRSSMEMTKEQKIIDYINDGIIIFNEKGILIYANSKAKNIYKKIGYKHNILGTKFSNIVLNNIAFKDVLDGIIPGSSDIHIAKMDLNIHYYLIKESKNVKNVVLFIKDLTEIKEKEKELILKSVAIKEIHHRVKNNLQTIASLLRIQARKTEDEAVRQAFNESINRILSIAVTHEILAQNGLDDLKIKEMFSKILKNSIRASIGENLDLKTSISGDDFKINSDKSTSIALIANELVQNSITHGFKGMTSGKIDITVKQGKIKSKVTIADNGVGFKSKDFKNESLGLQIVKSLVKEKLFGTIDIKSTKNGTIIVFDFEN